MTIDALLIILYGVFMFFSGALISYYLYYLVEQKKTNSSPVRVQSVIQKIKAGQSFYKIAHDLNTSRTTVNRIAKRYGLKSKYKFGGNYK